MMGSTGIANYNAGTFFYKYSIIQKSLIPFIHYDALKTLIYHAIVKK